MGGEYSMNKRYEKHTKILIGKPGWERSFPRSNGFFFLGGGRGAHKNNVSKEKFVCFLWTVFKYSVGANDLISLEL